MTGKKHLVRTRIMGEEYAIRSDAPPEHTRAVAAYVDRAIKAIVDAGPMVETHKAAILAALQITDELFRARAADASLAADIRSLGASLRRLIPPTKRVSLGNLDALEEVRALDEEESAAGPEG